MKKRKHPGFDAPYFDEEERDIIEAVEGGEFVPARSRDQAMKEWQAVVRHSQRKKPITVRIQEEDVRKLKVRALQKGMPYQTLVASILHQYANGTLKEEA